MEDLMQEEDIIITVTKNGFIKRMSPDAFRQIRRGGKGSSVMGVRDDDVIESMFLATTHSFLMVFTSIGKVHWIKGYQIPEGGRQASGRAIVNLLQLQEDENITALMPIRKFDDVRRVFMITRKGICKMVMLEAFSRPKAKGIIAINLDKGDELVSAKPIFGGEQVVVATKKGYAIRFCEDEVRVMGRAARGVKAITFRDKNDEIIGMEVFSKLTESDRIVAEEIEKAESDSDLEVVMAEAVEVEVVEPEESENDSEDQELESGDEESKVSEEEVEDLNQYNGKILTVSELGYGKQTDINDYRVTHRGGKGVINLKIMDKTGDVLAIKRMFEGDELMIVTTSGKVVRMNADSVRNTGRAASGVKLITLESDDNLISVVRIPAAEEKAD
jgi:DNA gyrase subunit A